MKRTTSLFIILIVIQFMTAWLCGPYSCEWGNTAYFYTGLIVALVALLLPFLEKSLTTQKKIGMGLLFLLGIIATWIIGFLAADFKIMCRLF